MGRRWAHVALGRKLPVVTVAAGIVLAAAILEAPESAADAPVRVNCPAADLQAAINNAPPGATLLVSGTCIGTFSIGKNLRLIGQGTAELNGNGNSAATVTIASGASVRLMSLTITGGAGGGIRNDGALTVRGSDVTGNGSITAGGIVNNGTLTLNESPVTGNIARQGGGISNTGTATLHDSPVTANRALVGGGIFNDGTLTLDDSAVTNNLAGLAIGGIGNFGTVTLHDSPVTGNTPDNCEPPGSVAGCSG